MKWEKGWMPVLRKDAWILTGVMALRYIRFAQKSFNKMR